MGCDIHMVLEQKSGEKWVGIDTYQGHEAALQKGYAWPEATQRNYKRFARLAGVRGEGPEPRGLPEDISDTTRLLSDHWGSDGHSHSWLPLSEAAQVFLETMYGEQNDYMRKYPASHFFGCDLDDNSQYRVVFWFDN